jgi:hypothetical protein
MTSNKKLVMNRVPLINLAVTTTALAFQTALLYPRYDEITKEVKEIKEMVSKIKNDNQ